jgi:demethoxyubiquinone hydroxylase (CLK1/Coq7/Cat5 family)
MTRLRANDQVDVRNLVAVADQRLTKKEVRCHVVELLFGKSAFCLGLVVPVSMT